jgi:hypothetical protein
MEVAPCNRGRGTEAMKVESTGGKGNGKVRERRRRCPTEEEGATSIDCLPMTDLSLEIHSPP